MRVTPGYTDIEYLEGIRNAEIDIERAFYKHHLVMVKDLVRKMDSTGRIDAKDLYQEVMTVVFMKIKGGELTELRAKLSSYVYSVASNLLLYELRKNERLPRANLDDNEVAEEIEPSVTIQDIELKGLELVRRLRYPCNELIIDWYINKLNFDEIATKFKYSNGDMARKKKSECLKGAREQAKQLKNDYLNQV
jgi:RNA polymerase sigma factor (sigma-70 family)